MIRWSMRRQQSLKPRNYFEGQEKEQQNDSEARRAGSVKMPTLFSEPGNVYVQINKRQARAEHFLAADKANVYTMRKARLIYESKRAGFMADHKSVSAQLTLGNFPTPFSNQNPLPGRFQGRPTTGRRWGYPSLPRQVEVGELDGESWGPGGKRGQR